jgi:hypothetical protein
MKRPATIFYKTAFGVAKEEVNLLTVSRTNYAQYTGAPTVQFIRKRKRKSTGMIATNAPYMVILDGHDHDINPADPFKVKSTQTVGTTQITTRITEYSAFDDQPQKNFDNVLNEYLKSVPVACILMDVRHTCGTDIVITE